MQYKYPYFLYCDGFMSHQCFSTSETLASIKGRIPTPPRLLYFPGPSVAVDLTLERWLRTPPLGEFEQVVLYRYGPAQVGLNQSFTSCCRLLAPFKTEPTMPAAHTRGEASLRYFFFALLSPLALEGFLLGNG